jgi:hypothetical protein
MVKFVTLDIIVENSVRVFDFWNSNTYSSPVMGEDEGGGWEKRTKKVRRGEQGGVREDKAGEGAWAGWGQATRGSAGYGRISSRGRVGQRERHASRTVFYQGQTNTKHHNSCSAELTTLKGGVVTSQWLG